VLVFTILAVFFQIIYLLQSFNKKHEKDRSCVFVLLLRVSCRRNILKMLGRYLDTLISRHNFCNMLSILNELTLQKGMTKFRDK